MQIIIAFVSFLSFAFGLKPVIRGDTAPFKTSEVFQKDFLVKDNVQISFLREAELKHGRLAMLSSIIIPTLEQFTDGLGIHQFQNLPDSMQLSIVGMMFVSEFSSMIRGWENPLEKPFTLKEDYQPGDFEFQLWKSNETESLILMDKELNNGRLAMIGVIGMIIQELVTGNKLFA